MISGMDLNIHQTINRLVFIKGWKGLKILLAFLWFFLSYHYILHHNQKAESIYIRRAVHNANIKWRPKCDKNRFSLYGMEYCSPRLNCSEIYNEVEKIKYLDRGSLKEVYLANWKGYTVVWNEIRKHVFNSNLSLLQSSETFLKGARTLDDLQSSENFVTQIIGKCDTITITEYYQLGSIRFLDQVMEAAYGDDHRAAAMKRMQLCIDYVEILDYLHTWNPNRTYVMCDSYSMIVALGQFLLTDRLRLVLNDVDYMVFIDHLRKEKISCGEREQFDLMAPEMVRTHQNRSGINKMNLLYDEKIEIWKIPNMCYYFLGARNSMINGLKLQMLDIHSRCKNIDPSKRPSAKEVLQVYRSIQFPKCNKI